MLSEISREPRELPWQPNLGKNKPKLHKLQFCARNPGIYHIIKRFSASANSNMVYKISWESRWLPWQPNLGQKIALISSLQEIGKIIACTVGISGLVNFNTLSEFLMEPRELPWQPNLNKKAKIALISDLCKKSRNFSHEKSGFWVGDFKYAITIFKGTKGVALATKFRKI